MYRRNSSRAAGVAGSFACLALLALPAAARADTGYRVSGIDSFTLGGLDQRGVITYDGAERLTVEKRAGKLRFTAIVRYTRIDQGAKSTATGSFVEIVEPNGDTEDVQSDDPDFLTILNQPFSIQLDGEAQRALNQLKGAVPFDFPAPMVGASLRGTLRRSADGEIAGRRSIGLVFSAAGPLSGRLPGHPQALAGTMRLDGRAYYDVSTALLLALELTLEISGHVTGDVVAQPVTIVYRRSIRLDPHAVKEAPR
jgi:hypothetical protein